MAALDSFPRTRDALDRALSARVFPCAVAEVGRAQAPIFTYARGHLTYDAGAPAADADTIFDLASLTKVLATATIALLQVHQSALALDGRLADLVPEWTGNERASVTVTDLLEHCSGLPAHRKYFLTLAGRAAYQAAICAEALVYPPRTQSLYSDPGFMLLGFVLEGADADRLDAQITRWRRIVGHHAPLTYHPPTEWGPRIAPTEIDPWRGRLLIGDVHDENAAALGGVAAHAGLFGTAAGVGEAARWWLSRLLGEDDVLTGIKSREAAAFAQPSTVAGSSRALGWDTMLPTSSCGTRMSARAIGHTGFTGTSLWLDPEQNFYAVLLTNRVHPTRANDAIQPVRRAFHDAVVADLQEQS